MTGSHVPPSESGASGLPWDALIDGGRLPETEDEMAVEQLLAALRAPGTPEELRGADAAVAALLAHRAAAAAEGGEVVPFVPPRRRRTAVLVGTALAGTVLFAGTAAAATGSLPAPMQRLLHDVAGAPAPAADEATPTTAPTQASGQPGPTARPTAPASSRPTARPTAPNPVASEHRATPTPPGQSVKPSMPPGQTVRPTEPSGQTQRPTVRPSPNAHPTATKAKASTTTSHT